MKIKINASVKELERVAIPLEEATRLSGSIVEAEVVGGQYTIPRHSHFVKPKEDNVWYISCSRNWVEELPPQVKLDLTKPVQTRDGRAVEIKFVDDRLDSPVVGILEGDLWSWKLDGKACQGHEGCDLVQAPEPTLTREVWLNIYAKDLFCYESKERADQCARNGSRLACVKLLVNFKKGEGL